MAKLIPVRSFDDCIRLARERGTSSIKLGYQTRLYIYQENATLYLHEQPIIFYDANGDITLNSRGYRTRTTLDRFNQLLPEGWRVVQVRGQWVVVTPDGNQEPFEDGYTLHCVAMPQAIGPRQLDWYVEKYLRKLWKRTIPRPPSGWRALLVHKPTVRAQFLAREFGWELGALVVQGDDRAGDTARAVISTLLGGTEVWENWHREDNRIKALLKQWLMECLEGEKV